MTTMPPAAVSSPAEPQQLASLLAGLLPTAGQRWLATQQATLATGDAAAERSLFVAFSRAGRQLGHGPLRSSTAQRNALAAQGAGFDATGITADQAGRLALLLSWPASSATAWTSLLDKLCASGELSELVALYRGLPLYPHPQAHTARAAEGVRSNMKAVFAAVATQNPYPAAWLDEIAWNQLVLKCIFVDVSLDTVVGLDARANAALALMLCDYAHERWAASRSINPQLWRCVGPFAERTPRALAALDRLLTTGTAVEQQAAWLALRAAGAAGATVLAQANHAALVNRISRAKPAPTWQRIAAATASS